jgi:serine/threonine-protein kinase
VPPEIFHVLPQWVAGDDVLLYTARSAGQTWGNDRIVAERLATSERHVLVRDGADARVVAPGILVFMRQGKLLAVSFDAARLAVHGMPIVVVDAVAHALEGYDSGDATGAGQFAVSAAGALAYMSSPVVHTPDSALVSVERNGRVTPLPIERHRYQPGVCLAPDGSRLSVEVSDVSEQSLWIADLARGTIAKLTRGGETHWSRWTPDGSRIAFVWDEGGRSRLAWARPDGGQPPETLAARELPPASWAPDGRSLATVGEGGIWMVDVGSSGTTPSRLTQGPAHEESPDFSPDGRWLAYSSDVTGRMEVYVRPFPGPGAPTLVSTTGGWNPAWNRRGGELFYIRGDSSGGTDRQMMAVPIQNGRAGAPAALFAFDAADVELGWCYPARCYDVSADGQRFYGIRSVTHDPLPPVTHLNLVLNWTTELAARLSAAAR